MTHTLGHGIGLRTPHYPRVLDDDFDVDWFEVISENFMLRGGRPLAVLEKARAQAPLALHGVSLSIGSTDPVRLDYLRDLRSLIDRFEPAIVSDHLCWGSVGGAYAHDLLPLPYTEEALRLVVSRVEYVQERLGLQILLENVSSYLTFEHSDMTEWNFLSTIAEQADCGILLDVNNVYVSARNHGFDPLEYLTSLPPARVQQIHLAGHTDCGTHLLDTHDAPVVQPVWDLYRAAVARFGQVPTLVEWDDAIPSFEDLIEETKRARAIECEVMNGIAGAA